MSDDIKKGLLGIVVDETEVSKVMPEINSLTYRGYAAQDLCEYCRFEEVAYLILNKDLPNSIQLKKFEKEERNNRELSKDLYAMIKRMPKKSHPMDVARTAVSFMGLEDKETSNSSPEANMRKALRIFAKTPTALAAFYRIRKIWLQYSYLSSYNPKISYEKCRRWIERHLCKWTPKQYY